MNRLHLLTVGLLWGWSAGLAQLLPHPEYCGTGKLIPGGRTEQASDFTSIHCEPAVVRLGEPFSIIIGVKQTDLKEIEMENKFPQSRCIQLNNQETDKFILKDDGTQGDQKAGDKLFTVSGLTITCAFFDGAGLNIFQGNFTFIYKSGRKETKKDIPVYFGVRYSPPRFEIPAVKPINAKAQYTEYVFNLVTTDPEPNEAKTKEYYKYFPDDRDFLVFSTTHFNPEATPNAAGYYLGIQNKIKGLFSRNINSYDDSRNYGSKNILQGIIVTQAGYSMDKFLITHELLHRWGMFMDASLGISDFFHYGNVFMGPSGFGGATIKTMKNINDTTLQVTYGSSLNHFNPLELYLMGLWPIDSVNFPFTVYQEVSSITNPGAGQVQITYRTKKQVSKTDYLKAMDVRSPGPPSAQKTFKLGLIVTSPRLLTPDELSFFHNMAYEYELNKLAPEIDFCHDPNYPDCGNNTFTMATQERASLTTRIATFETTTAVHPVNNNLLKVYPNPAQDRLYLDVQQELTGPLYYALYDLTGRKLQNGWWPAGESIPLTTAYQGLALLTLREQKTQKIFTEKIYIQKQE